MEPVEHPVFAEIEEDGAEPVAAAFARLASRYFAQTRSGDGPVSTALSPEELKSRCSRICRIASASVT